MDNVQRNASDMISSLQMQYNRGCPAAITNELIDITTGKCRILSTAMIWRHHVQVCLPTGMENGAPRTR